MPVYIDKKIELVLHYTAFSFKSVNLALFLPFAGLISSSEQLMFTSLILSLMYIILAAEFGFSIQISKFVGDNTDRFGNRHSINVISKITSKIFAFLVVCGLAFSTLYYKMNEPNLMLVDNHAALYALSVLVFLLQLFTIKSYALSMSTEFLKYVKLIETCVFASSLFLLFLNLAISKSWITHLSIFLTASFSRSILLYLLERRIINSSIKSNAKHVSVKQFLSQSSEIGLSSLSTQILINTLLSKVYQSSNVNIGNDINLLARITQGAIVAVRQVTDLRFFQTSRDLLPNDHMRQKIVKNNIFWGLLSIFATSVLILFLFHAFKSVNDVNYELFTVDLFAWIFLLSSIFGCGLVAQQLLLIDIIAHRYIAATNVLAFSSIFYADLQAAVIFICALYGGMLAYLTLTARLKIK